MENLYENLPELPVSPGFDKVDLSSLGEAIKLKNPTDQAELDAAVAKFAKTPTEAIRLAGVNTLRVMLKYTKATTGETKHYVVDPYSYRVKRPKTQNEKLTWYFFGYDATEQQIKSYVVRNIRDAKVLPEKFTPKWKVEFWAK